MHGTLPATPPKRSSSSRLPLLLRLALRELRGGLKGFGIFLACIALGVAAIAGVSSLSRSLTEGLSREGRRILGGDMAFSLIQREAARAERAFLESKGQVTSIASMRAMAVAGDKGSGLVELKAVDGGYPTVGALETDPQLPAAELFAERNGAFGAAVDPALLARLDLKVGDRVTVGRRRCGTAGARSSPSPTRSPTASASGRGCCVSQEALRATGLLQPGSLVRWTYRLNLPPEHRRTTGLDADRGGGRAASCRRPAGTSARGVNADPRFARNIERFTQFLTLVGLTALLVGGVGVANAVRGFVDRKRASIATLKSLGAPGGQVVALYLIQVMLIAGVGIAHRARRRRGPAVPDHGAVRPSPADPDRSRRSAWSELGVALALRRAHRPRLRASRRLGAPTTCRSPASSATRSTRSGAGRASAIWRRSALSVAALVGLSRRSPPTTGGSR